jgi:hypothetical protein
MILGLKNYNFGGTWRQAGVPSNAVRDEYGNVQFEQAVPFLQSLRDGTPFTSNKDTMKKSLKENCRHGNVIKGGKVVPYTAYIKIDKKTGEEYTAVM